MFSAKNFFKEYAMKVNEGKVDRVVRALLGIVLFVLGFLFIKGTLGIILGIASILLLVTAATGFCGLYALLKINTRKPSEA
jgi:hypothetical protein